MNLRPQVPTLKFVIFANTVCLTSSIGKARRKKISFLTLARGALLESFIHAPNHTCDLRRPSFETISFLREKQFRSVAQNIDPIKQSGILNALNLDRGGMHSPKV